MATEHDLCVGSWLPPLGSAEFLHSYRPGLQSPSRLALDASGNLYVADPARNQLVVRAPDGRVLGRKAFAVQPQAIAVDDGNGRPLTIYVGESSSGRVTAYSADWQPLRHLGQGAGEFVSVNDLAVEPERGRVYVIDSEADLIRIYAPDGSLLGSFGGHGSEPGSFDFPAAMTVDPVRRELLVTDQMNFRVQIFDLDGNFVCRLGDANGASPDAWAFGTRARLFTVPQGIAIDAQGRIYVADAAEGRIRVVDPAGALLGEIAGFGEGANRLRVPLDLVIDRDGRLFVSDSNNARLVIYGLESFTDTEAFAPADVTVTPDPFDLTAGGEPVAAVIEVPGHPLHEVVVGSITANGVPAESGSVEFTDHDGDWEPDLYVTFERDAVGATLPSTGQGAIVFRGRMAELDFHGTVFVTVIGGDPDDDDDGVSGEMDQCPGTPPGSAIDATGCAIVQLCPCGARMDGAPWTTHGDFVTCTAGEARRFAEAGFIGRAEVGAIVSAANRAECPGKS